MILEDTDIKGYMMRNNRLNNGNATKSRSEAFSASITDPLGRRKIFLSSYLIAGLMYVFSLLLPIMALAGSPLSESPLTGAPNEKGIEQTIVALGDSLTAGYMLAPGAGFPEQLEIYLEDQGHRVTVINAGVSGDTTQGGLSRLSWALSDAPDGKPDMVIVELGGNDMLRGIDPKRTRANLAAIIEQLQAKDIQVMLAGLISPTNMGPDYEHEFNAIYPELAAKYDVPLYPFFLEGVADDPDLMRVNDVHPNEKGIKVLVQNIGPHVIKVLAELSPPS